MIIGWYKNAILYRNFQKVGKRDWIVAECTAKNSVLLPTYNRNCIVPLGKNSIGQKNISYLFDYEGNYTKKKWLDTALDYISNYNGPNIFLHPEEELQSSYEIEKSFESIKSSSQGFNSDPKNRRSVELYAMKKAINYYKSIGFKVTDISSSFPCDLQCNKKDIQMYVEVKGSQMNIDKIILTKNEVRFINKNKGKTRLFLCENIKCFKNKASGGNTREIKYLILKKKNLLPLQYLYEL